MKLWLAILSLALAGTCAAAPKKTEAEAWGQDFRQLRDKTTDALFLRDAVGTARKPMRVKLDALEAKAKKLFGSDEKFYSCENAATRLTVLFEFLPTAVGSGGFMNASTVARQSLEIGQRWGNCSDAIDSIK
jgi:hypothetical protein